ncbi:MAG: hypothetical protein KF721_00365 [Ignavibacteriaceae bacterium]|nr:hypothetical protein [Ignavibacteriaceae bacterium]
MMKSIVLYSLLFFGFVTWLVFMQSNLIIEKYHFFYFILSVGVWFLSYHYFGGRFIRPQWKKVGKLFAYLIISSILILSIAHYSLIFIIGHQLLGGVGHFMICKKHGIDWKTCQPEEKYIELTEKWAKGDFS